MKVAAYQAPLLPCGSMEAVDLIRERVRGCEAEGVAILCCPEAILGGLADDAPHPAEFAIDVQAGKLEKVLAPLASDMVTTIIGFSEITAAGELYNAAAVFHRRSVAGVYRKLHPAIRKSVYRPGNGMPVFRIDGLTFGIVICNDSNFAEPAQAIAAAGATVMFVPSNNALPAALANVVAEARNVDVARAREHKLWVVRADVAGRNGDRLSWGSSCIVDPEGTVLQLGLPLTEGILVADIGPASKPRSDGGRLR